MYTTIRGPAGLWDFVIRNKHRRVIMESPGFYVDKSRCINGAKKMAKELNIEYREVK